MVSLTDWNASKAEAEQEATLHATGTSTTPGAVATIASVTAVKGGMYEITILAGYGATADVINNMDLAVGGVQELILPISVAANALHPSFTIKKRVNAAQVIAVRSIAAAGAGAIYRAVLVAKRVSN